MIILDTNVVSEPMRNQADPAVAAWLDRQTIETLFFTATGLSELLLGIELLPAGRRRAGLGAAAADLVAKLFGPRILAFDQQAASAYAQIVGQARAAGVSISVGDGQIAAIAAAWGFIVATRDTAPFTAARLTVINPWRPDA